jgi:TPP-dependent indolepyruvate ferredoxin oxidoreductase alpha subunit
LRGWIRISRDRIRALLKRIKRPYSELEAWLDIEASVRFSEKSLERNFKGREFMIKEAQMLTSKKEFAQKWSWNKKRVQRFLERLEREKEIKIQSYKGIGLMITSLEYLRLKEVLEEIKKRKKSKEKKA